MRKFVWLCVMVVGMGLVYYSIVTPGSHPAEGTLGGFATGFGFLNAFFGED